MVYTKTARDPRLSRNFPTAKQKDLLCKRAKIGSILNPPREGFDGIKNLAERARTKKRRLRGLRRLWVGDQDLEGNCPHDSHPTILATLGSQLNSEHRQLLILG